MRVLSPSLPESTEDQRLLIEAVREFARAELIEADRLWDREESSMVSILPQLAEMGLMNTVIPEEFGGLGCDLRTYSAIIHELAYASPSVAVAISVHTMVGSILEKTASEPLRTEWVSRYGSPDHLAAFAISEADAGSDPSGVRTSARAVKGGYLLNGEKMWITNGMSARWFLILTRLENGGSKGPLCAFMVDGNSPGIGRDKILGKMGIRGSETAVIALHDVFVPAEHLLGGEGQGGRISATTLTEGRVGIASQATGIAHACLDAMVDYARQREQFGQVIGKFQAVSNMIADSAVELAAARELIWKAAARIDAGESSLQAACMAKLYATEAANRIAYRAVQVHGGMGFVKECRVERLYRDARVTTIYEGTSEIQRYAIAKHLP